MDALTLRAVLVIVNSATLALDAFKPMAILVIG
jgi:hypothetical protein